ncbi:MAG TPA: hypothetical protein VGO62_04550 [Myxococcota bacterium]|jgi:hypothetical protein
MQVRHGGLVLDVPSDWLDQSSLLFVAPRAASTLPSAVKVSSPVESLAVRTVVVDAGVSARALLDADNAALASVDASADLVSEGALGAGYQRVHRVTLLGHPLRQVSFALVVGELAVLATATCAEARYASVKAELEAMLVAIRVG